MKRLAAVLMAVVALVALVAGVAVLRSLTMTRHVPMPAGSRLDVDARARWRAGSGGVERRTRALTLGCVTETRARSRVSGFHWRADGRFRFAVRPGLDGSDRRQLRGCLHDLRVPGVIVEVVDMRIQGDG